MLDGAAAETQSPEMQHVYYHTQQSELTLGGGASEGMGMVWGGVASLGHSYPGGRTLPTYILMSDESLAMLMGSEALGS